MSNREKLRIVIFGTSTPAGKLFDVILLWLILVSVLVIIVDSIPGLGEGIYDLLRTIEWAFTFLFSIEYILRIYSSENRKAYLFSSWGIIDLLAILPGYISIFSPGYHYLFIIRMLRLLRIFPVLGLFRFTKEGQMLLQSLKISAYKMIVFMSFAFTIVVLASTLMFVVENGNPGFSSIPASIYWGIVTITTVGYGDTVPLTYLGKIIASAMMLSGYAFIVVPIGILTVELTKTDTKETVKKCENCGNPCKDTDHFCSNCGQKLNDIEF